MVKTLQAITLIFGITGCVMGFMLLSHQSGRNAGDSSSTLEVHTPCLDANGEPTC